MSTISSGTTLTTALVQTGDTTGNLVIKTGSSNTTAMTISGTDQSITFAGAVNVASSAFANGSVSAPSITFTGDTNTGIFSPAADTIAFTEGGVESVRITSAGNVGIGTSSPNDTLEVAGANAFIRVNRTSAEPGITFRYSNSSTNRGDIAVTSGGAMYFTAGGSTERMRITAAGGVAFNGAYNFGSSGQVLQSNGDAAPTWVTASSIGVGQTWQSVSRSSGTTYTNSTGRAIQIMVATDNTGNSQYGSGNSAKFYINGNNVGEAFCSNAANVGGLFQAIIPPSSTYQVSASIIRSWWELR
jgi:hypothetical protein